LGPLDVLAALSLRETAWAVEHPSLRGLTLRDIIAEHWLAQPSTATAVVPATSRLIAVLEEAGRRDDPDGLSALVSTLLESEVGGIATRVAAARAAKGPDGG
jgi:hypothetical protein